MTYQFVNRIWVSRMGKSKVRRILLVVLGVFIALLSLLQVLIDGWRSVNWVSSGLVPMLLIGLGMLNSGRGGYITAECWVSFEPGGIQVTYPLIHRQDKNGAHKEIHFMGIEDICAVQYSESLQSFRIVGWESGVNFLPDGNRCFTASPGESPTQIILYPPKEYISGMLSDFECRLGVSVMYMDKQ